jgi:uncharacterized membrane protein
VHCFGGTTDACAVDTAFEPWTLITIPRPQGISSARAHDVNDNGLVVGTMGGSIGDFGFIYNLTNGELTLLPSGVSDGVCSISAINSLGTVCGKRSIVGPPTYSTNAFIWSAQQSFIDLGVMNGPNSAATDINDDNTVTGWTGSNQTANNCRGFLHSNGNTTIFDPIPNGENSLARDINNSGQLILSGELVGGGGKSFAWKAGVLTELLYPPFYSGAAGSSTAESGIVAGNLISLSNRACLWQNGHPIEVADLLLTPGYTMLGATCAPQTLNLVGTAKNPQNETLTIYLIPNFSIEGDATCDGTVSVNDLYQVINDWGACGDCRTDFNNDGTVNVPDLLHVINHWTFSK